MSDKLDQLENVTPEVDEVEETVEEVIEEAVEEISEEIQEVTQEVIEEVGEEDSVENEDEKPAEEPIEDDAVETVEPDKIVDEYAKEEVLEPAKKKSPVVAIVAAVVVAVAIIAIAFSMLINNPWGNKYNKMGYVPVSGMSIQEVADQLQIELDEFLKLYGLPEDMPADTTQEAAFYNIPLSVFAQMNGYDYESLKDALSIPDMTTVSEPKTLIEKIKSIFKSEKPQPITEDTPWGIVLDELTVGAYVGPEQVEEFKVYYELDESVTADTLYKDVKDQINKKTLEMMAEEEAQKKEAEALAEEQDKAIESEEVTDDEQAPVEEEVAQEEVSAE